MNGKCVCITCISKQISIALMACVYVRQNKAAEDAFGAAEWDYSRLERREGHHHHVTAGTSVN